MISFLRISTDFPNMCVEDMCCKMLKMPIMIEGDDSTVLGPAFDQELVRSLGWLIKSVVYPHCMVGGFCGIMRAFDGGTNISDPYKAVCKFFWLDSQYLNAGHNLIKALMRGRALSYRVLYKDCPVIGMMAWATLKLTSGRKAHIVSSYNAPDLNLENVECISLPEVDYRSRILMHERFGMEINEQIEMETSFKTWSESPNTPLIISKSFVKFQNVTWQQMEPCTEIPDWCSDILTSNFKVQHKFSGGKLIPDFEYKPGKTPRVNIADIYELDMYTAE